MRKLGNVDVCGVRYTVCELRKGENPEPVEEAHEGYTDSASCRIYVRKAPPERQREIIFHEILHALLHESGIARVLGKVTRLDGDALDDFEEDVVRLLTPTLRTTLRGAIRQFGGLL